MSESTRNSHDTTHDKQWIMPRQHGSHPSLYVTKQKKPLPASMSIVEAIPAILTNSRAHQQLIVSLLKTCTSINKLTQLHSQIITNGFAQKNFLMVRVLSLYTNYGHLNSACKVFDEIRNPSTTVWNQMICGYGYSSKTPQKSVELFTRMLKEETLADEYTYSYLVSVCARFLMFGEGKQIHGRVFVNGFCSNGFISTSLINLYIAMEDSVGLAYAHKVFDEMPRKNSVVTWNSLLAGHIRCKDFDGARRIFDGMSVRTIVTWTTMLSGSLKNGWYWQALVLFREMRQLRLELDEVILVTGLSVCAEVGDLSLGKWIHSYVIMMLQGRCHGDINVRLQNALIHMYASCGEIEVAYRIFKDMPRRTVVSWTSMIVGFAKQGSARKALDVFEWMQNSEEVNPDAITFLGVLSACSHDGYVEEGRLYFKEMREKWAIKPWIEHYGCMVDLFSRAGLLDEALGLIKSMPMNPNDVVWGALLNGCIIHKNPEIALFAAQKLMMTLDDEQAVDYLKPISNVYAMTRRWGDMAILRQKMVEPGSKNKAGRSWVQINEAIHDFTSGDTTHRYASSIYEMLDKLAKEVRCEASMHDLAEDFAVI